ncbi:hypothetical protein, partial [Bacillus cereus]|uniref:hypothetical protein n=1 Tax=Bacillus cereus TaxID=1396 RepID=UPI00197A707D
LFTPSYIMLYGNNNEIYDGIPHHIHHIWYHTQNRGWTCGLALKMGKHLNGEKVQIIKAKHIM